MTNWEKCVAFHGHACGGLTIGYKAACYAAELLERQPAVSYARQAGVFVL